MTELATNGGGIITDKEMSDADINELIEEASVRAKIEEFRDNQEYLDDTSEFLSDPNLNDGSLIAAAAYEENYLEK